MTYLLGPNKKNTLYTDLRALKWKQIYLEKNIYYLPDKKDLLFLLKC